MATTPLQFMSLLTPQEQGAITAAALQSPQIMLFLLMLAASTEVNLGDPRTTGGLVAMVSAGLLTQARGDAIIAAMRADRPPLRTIATTEAIHGNPQADGRFWLTEVFTLSDGSVQTSNILCDPSTDADALLAQHAAALTALLAQEASVG